MRPPNAIARLASRPWPRALGVRRSFNSGASDPRNPPDRRPKPSPNAKQAPRPRTHPNSALANPVAATDRNQAVRRPQMSRPATAPPSRPTRHTPSRPAPGTSDSTSFRPRGVRMSDALDRVMGAELLDSARAKGGPAPSVADVERAVENILPGAKRIRDGPGGKPYEAAPLTVGDLVEVRRGPRVELGVIVRVPQADSEDPAARRYMTINGDGHTMLHFGQDVLFQACGWAFSQEVAEAAATERRNHRIVGLSAEAEEIMKAEKLDQSLIQSLVKFREQTEKLSYDQKQRLGKVYNQFHLIENVESVTVNDVARWSFATAADGSSREPTHAECYAAFAHLAKSSREFTTDADAEEIRRTRSFNVRSADEIVRLMFLENEMRPATTARPGEEKTDQPSAALKSFLTRATQRIEWAKSLPMYADPTKPSTFTVPPPPELEFTLQDLDFIAAIKEYTFANSSKLPNPYAFFVNRAIMSQLPGYNTSGRLPPGPSAGQRGLDGVRLLKDLGVWQPYENITIPAMLKKGHIVGVEGLEGHDTSPWAEDLAADSLVWGDRLIAVPDFHNAPSAEKTIATSSTPSLIEPEPTFKSSDMRAPPTTAPPLLAALRSRVIFPQQPLTDAFPTADAHAHLRRDFTSQPVYVIDSPTAQELDDGVSIERRPDGDWIHVHIADPTAYLTPNHPLSMLAQLKGCSIYLPERHYPMLPDRVSQERFSLGKGGCAMTFSARLAEDGEIADWGVCLSQLADVRVCHYRDVNQAIGWQDEPSAEAYGTVWERKAAAELRGLGKSGGGMDEKARAELRALAGEAARHMRWRVKQGGLNSNQPGLSVKVEPYPSPMTPPLSLAPLTPEEVRAGAAAVWLDPNQVGHVEPASRMVSECMVIAGRVAAKWCQEMGVPAIYRTQASLLDGLEEGSAGRGRVLAALEGVDADTGLLGGAAYRAVLPYFSPARSSLVLGGHGSMGIPGPRGADGVATESEMVGYVKVTSPLRRYKDLLMHWMMKARILELSRGGGAGVARTAPPFRDVDLEPLVARLAECERRQKKVMSGSERLWALEWIRRREVLWRGGATREVVDGRWRPSGKAVPHLGEGLRLPYVGGGGPREAQIWGGRYGANVTGFGEKEDLWAAAAEERCERPVYEVMVVRVDEGGNGAGGFLADLGGLQCRIQFANGSGMKEGGQLVKAVVEAVDPPAGVLMMSEI